MSLNPDLIKYYNQGLTAWSHKNIPTARENFAVGRR